MLDGDEIYKLLTSFISFTKEVLLEGLKTLALWLEPPFTGDIRTTHSFSSYTPFLPMLFIFFLSSLVLLIFLKGDPIEDPKMEVSPKLLDYVVINTFFSLWSFYKVFNDSEFKILFFGLFKGESESSIMNFLATLLEVY